MNASSLAGDLFTNFTLLSVAEFPGYLLSYMGMCLVGRRATLAASLLIGGLSCLAASLTPGIQKRNCEHFALHALHNRVHYQKGWSLITCVSQPLCLLLGQSFTCLESLAPQQLLAPHTCTPVSSFQRGRWRLERVCCTLHFMFLSCRVRNACVGLSSMCGRIGAILSPYVAR